VVFAHGNEQALDARGLDVCTELTFGCLSRCRRLSKEHEHSCRYSASWLYLASCQRMLNRFSRISATYPAAQAAA
jgi:hypothetical protein